MTNTANLKSKALTGSLWSLIENFSSQLVQFVVGIILARLLGPGNYGLIALTGIFTTISIAITDAGFEKTLIQRSDITPLQVSTIFYINIFLGVLVMLAFIISAPAIASFFKEPELTLVLRISSIGILLTAFGQTQQTLLTKELQIKRISFAKMASAFAGGVCGVVMAYNGYGVWSLVVSMLLAQIVKVLFFWIKANWYPSTQFSLASVKPMLGYGLNVMGSSIIFFCLQQFNNFIVGKVYSKADLGLFSRGTRFPEIIISIIQGAILNISLPLFAKLQHDNAGLQNAMMRALRTVAFVTFPIMGLMLVKAEDITIILLTEKWRGSIIFLQLFCVVYCFEPVIAIHRELILAKGNSRLLLLIFIAVSVFEVALVLSLCRLGIMYVVIAAAISKLTQYVVYTFVNAREMGIEAIKQINWLLPFVLFTACTSAFVWGLHKLLLQHVFTNKWVIAGLAIELMIGGAVYLAITYFFKIKESELITQAFNMVLQKLPGRGTHKN